MNWPGLNSPRLEPTGCEKLTGGAMELWIPITIAAAFLQNLRSALQKHLKGRLSTVGAAYARFLYAWPFALVYVWGLHEIGGLAWPAPNMSCSDSERFRKPLMPSLVRRVAKLSRRPVMILWA